MMIGHLIERLLGWALVLLWKREEPKLSTDFMIPIPGVGNVPASLFEAFGAKVIPALSNGLKAGQSWAEIESALKANVEPAAIGLSESLLNIMFPGVRTLEAFFVFLVENSKPMTQEETNAWMDRQGAGPT